VQSDAENVRFVFFPEDEVDSRNLKRGLLCNVEGQTLVTASLPRHQCVIGTLAKLVVPGLTLERVWGALREGEWESRRELEAASGVDTDTLTRMINFLERWDYVETRSAPDPQVRRKSNVVSPLETFQLLHSITRQQTKPARSHVIAERVACCKCRGQQLRVVGLNEVECCLCHERQWHVIERREPLSSTPKTLRTLLLKR